MPLNSWHLSETALTHAQPLKKSEGVEIAPLGFPVNSIVEFSFSDVAIAETAIKEIELQTKKNIEILSEKLEAAGFRASFLIYEKPIMRSIADWADRTFTNTGDVDPPAKGGIRK